MLISTVLTYNFVYTPHFKSNMNTSIKIIILDILKVKLNTTYNKKNLKKIVYIKYDNFYQFKSILV